jgi:hypothetical protein
MTPSSAAIKLFQETFSPEKDFTRIYSDASLETHGKDTGMSDSKEWWTAYCREKSPDITNEKRTSFEFAEGVFGKEARLQVSRAYRGKCWSVSVRWNPGRDARISKGPERAAIRPRNAPKNDPRVKPQWRAQSGYGLAIAEGPFLFSIDEIVNCLSALLMDDKDAAELGAGLIMVTGATNSSKSLIARGLVWRHLEARLDAWKEGDRYPHLVTFEDPIEEWVFPQDGDGSVPAGQLSPIDYTPRQLPADCKDLGEACKGALRQTPKVLYIGELREAPDIHRAVDFAGTGHLVVATGHAGTLIESAEKIFSAVNARDSGTRALVVPKIKALIHVRRIEQRINIQHHPWRLAGLVPTLYRRTTLGMQGLIGDGLFSLIPYYSEDDNKLSQIGCCGRQHLARKLGAAQTKSSQLGTCPDAGDLDGLTGMTLQNMQDLHEHWIELNRWNHDRSFDTPSFLKDPKGKNLSRPKRLIDVALWDDIHGR